MPKYHMLSRDMFSWNPSRQKKLESVITEAYKTTASALGKTTQIESLVRDYSEEGSDLLTA